MSQTTLFNASEKPYEEHPDKLTVSASGQLIRDLDFTQTISKCVNQYGWSRRKSHECSEHYKKYLYLILKYGDQYPLVPTIDIDEFWHMHILDTKKYMADCEAIFGRYLHHYPYFGIDGKTDHQRAEGEINMQEFFYKEYGEHLYTIGKGIRYLFFPLIKLYKRLANNLKFSAQYPHAS